METTTRTRKPRRRISVGTIVFYVLFFLFIGAFLFGLNYGLGELNTWLQKYESSQSTHKSQEVFAELFESPDWAALYEATGQADTLYEGAQVYQTYMEQLLEGRKLTMAKTSAGLDQNKEKYLVKLDKTVVADFTLVNADPQAQIPQWELDGLNIYFQRLQSVQVTFTPGCTVYINGVALDDSHIISTTATLAEEYLPEGLHGFREQTVRLEGLLTEPAITILDANGEAQEVRRDDQTGVYYQVVIPQTPSQEILDRAVGAGQAFARYMLADLGKGGMQTYFDTNGQAYLSLPATWELWVQDNRGFTLSEAIVSDYYQYSDSLYSIRVNITATVTRLDYSQKDYNMDTTLLFHLTGDGRWLVDNKTNEELQTRLTQVKLSYHVGSDVVHTEFVDSNTEKLTLPAVEIPQGKEFLGWYTKEVDIATGKTTMHLAFAPSADGVVYLDTQLPSMELYAQFK